MAPNNEFTAIVSLGGVALGGILGGLFPWLREITTERGSRQRQAQYLAIRVVCILDQFIEQCRDVVNDNGMKWGQRTEDGRLEANVEEPKKLEYPADVDWKSIDHKLMYSILSLPTGLDAANAAVTAAAEESFPPDYEEYYEERRYQFTKLGLEALDLCRAVRRKYKIPGVPSGQHFAATYLESRRLLNEEITARRQKTFHLVVSNTDH